MKFERAWLTGSGGFIGRRVAPRLAEVARKVVRVTNNPARAQDPSAASPLICVDYADREAVALAAREHGAPDLIVHLGWGAMEDPGSAEHVEQNVRDAKNLVDVLFENGLSTFVFIGSVNEYGAREGLLSEDMPAVGRMTSYARGKAVVAAHGLEVARCCGRCFISARVFYTYGAGQRSGSLINKLYRCSVDGTRAELGPCEHFRDYIHVDDVAEGIARVAVVPGPAVVNVGSGAVVQVRDFVTRFWSALDGDPENLVFGANPMRAGEPPQPRSYADLAKLRALTGWTPRLTLDEGIRKTVADLRSAPM